MLEKKVRIVTGTVVSRSGDKSVKVAIEYLRKHPKYGKYIKRRAKLGVHDQLNQSAVGDLVEVVQCRPRSKSKSWRLVRVVQKSDS
ncbi:30S ribosomal protein S17 [Planctomycetota bacterium]